ncbi:unnamed protein product, partial [Prorocentrum cordatum]
GYPLASLRFTLAFDLLLRCFVYAVDNGHLDITPACAAHVGFALNSLEVLPPTAAIFKFARMLASLTLKLHKCPL